MWKKDKELYYISYIVLICIALIQIGMHKIHNFKSGSGDLLFILLTVDF